MKAAFTQSLHAGYAFLLDPPKSITRLREFATLTDTRVARRLDDFRVLSDNLSRLGVVQQTFYGATTSGGSSSQKIYTPLALSPLGKRFIAACVGWTQ